MRKYRPSVVRSSADGPHSVASSDATEFSVDRNSPARRIVEELDNAIRTWPNEQPDTVPAEPQVSTPGVASPEPTPKQRKTRLKIASPIAKSIIAALAVIIFGWTPAQRLLAVTSAEATVNARVITIRAPIEGEIAMAANLEIGSPFAPGDAIVTITNPRVDQQHLNDLQRAKDKLLTTIAIQNARADALARRSDELTRQQSRFRQGRIEQLEKRIGEIDTQIASATADHDAANAALTRSRILHDQQVTTSAAFEKAVRDERVASEAINGLLEKRKGAEVELRAARSGTYVGDTYNDTPQSAQRGMDAALEIGEVTAQLVAARAELTSIETDLASEADRLARRSRADVTSSVQGRVWEVLTAAGEHVNAGQDLMRVLDCGSSIVTASVSESAYQNLKIGQPAVFQPRNGGAAQSGKIIGLNGLASVTSNTAIQQGALSREPYHVTLKVPALAATAACQVGQAGLVTFKDANPTPVAQEPVGEAAQQ